MHAWYISTPPPVGVDSVDKFRSGLRAAAELTVVPAHPDAARFVVDTRDLEVSRVAVQALLPLNLMEGGSGKGTQARFWRTRSRFYRH